MQVPDQVPIVSRGSGICKPEIWHFEGGVLGDKDMKVLLGCFLIWLDETGFGPVPLHSN